MDYGDDPPPPAERKNQGVDQHRRIWAYMRAFRECPDKRRVPARVAELLGPLAVTMADEDDIADYCAVLERVVPSMLCDDSFVGYGLEESDG